MPLYNPIGSNYIFPPGTPFPPPNHQYMITKTFAQHPADAKGIDVANDMCGGIIYPMIPGKVVKKFKDSSGALVLRYRGVDGFEYGIAHMSSYAAGTYVGAAVWIGKPLGYIGATGKATGCHVHQGRKNSSGVETDWWPLLWMNTKGHPASNSVNIRATTGAGSTLGALYASCKADGHIHRASDGKDLGLVSAPRALRQPINGATYTVGGVTDKLWVPFWLDGRWTYIAKPLLKI